MKTKEPGESGKPEDLGELRNWDIQKTRRTKRNGKSREPEKPGEPEKN